MTERVAVVTGAYRGIGREICRQLAKQGVRVVMTARDATKGEAARRALNSELCAEPGSAAAPVVFHKLDVTSAADIRTLVEFVTREFGRVDILVNNAGIMADPKGSRALDSKLQTYRESFETNVLAPLALIQACVPLMKKRNYGRIVNVSSELGQLSGMGSGTPAYRLSKTALNALTRIVAVETRATNILVNTMSPGWVRSEMGGPHAPRSVEQGADTAVWLATLPDDGPRGGFFHDRQPLAW